MARIELDEIELDAGNFPYVELLTRCPKRQGAAFEARNFAWRRDRPTAFY
jgi:hypothetical protein